MKKIIFYVALTGWSLSLIAHLLSLGGVDVADAVPFIWLLHVGIFVVLFPTILSIKDNKELEAYQEERRGKIKNPLTVFKILFKDTPTWLRLATVGMLFYAMVNFMIFMGNQQGSSDIQDGQFILHNRGTLIRVLTEQEYHLAKANELRGFSGHWLAFYGFGVALLFPFRNEEADKIPIKGRPKA